MLIDYEFVIAAFAGIRPKEVQRQKVQRTTPASAGVTDLISVSLNHTYREGMCALFNHHSIRILLSCWTLSALLLGGNWIRFVPIIASG